MAFNYAGGVLCAEQVSLEEIARSFGTPCYVYSKAAIERAYREFATQLAGRRRWLLLGQGQFEPRVLAAAWRGSAPASTSSRAASWRACLPPAATPRK
jgi:hypothetical protein